MTLEICPTCGVQDSIFLPFSPAVGLGGELYGGRMEAFCNNTQCDQRYWFYPESRRITRRNTGDTYAEWVLQCYSLSAINASRKRAGLELLVAEGEAERAGRALRTHMKMVGEQGPEGFVSSSPSRPSLRQRLYERWCWVRAFFVVWVPGFGRFSVCDDNG